MAVFADTWGDSVRVNYVDGGVRLDASECAYVFDNDTWDLIVEHVKEARASADARVEELAKELYYTLFSGNPEKRWDALLPSTREKYRNAVRKGWGKVG